MRSLAIRGTTKQTKGIKTQKGVATQIKASFRHNITPFETHYYALSFETSSLKNVIKQAFKRRYNASFPLIQLLKHG